MHLTITHIQLVALLQLMEILKPHLLSQGAVGILAWESLRPLQHTLTKLATSGIKKSHDRYLQKTQGLALLVMLEACDNASASDTVKELILHIQSQLNPQL